MAGGPGDRGRARGQWGPGGDPRGSRVLTPGLRGGVQGHNAAVAWATLERGGYLRDPDAAAGGLTRTRLVGRLQSVGRFLLDGAHNEDSGRVLGGYVAGEARTAIVGMLAGHDPESFLRALSPGVARVLAVPVENSRALAPELVAEAARRAGLGAEVRPSLAEALADPEASVVTGSFYLVGEALHLLT